MTMIPDTPGDLFAQFDADAIAAAHRFGAQIGAVFKQLVADGVTHAKAEEMAHGYLDGLLDVVRAQATAQATASAAMKALMNNDEEEEDGR